MIIDNDITEPKVRPIVQPAVKEAIQNQAATEQQVIVHGSYIATIFGDGIRIWPTTFLCDQHSDHKSTLVYTEGITNYPTWTLLEPGEKINFVLVFTGLPKTCTVFDLEEIIPQPDGFKIKNIRRNKTDVYHVRFD